MHRTQWLLLIFCFTIAQVAQARYFVGNGGEGIETSHGLYFRDLFERDLHQKRTMTDQSSFAATPELTGKMNSLLLTPEQQKMMLIKLGDAERLYPCLGELLAKAIVSYTWLWSSTPLGLLPEEGVIRSFPEAMRVQIANRAGTTIHIHQGSWDRLDDHNKAALLIHEALYSLAYIEPRWRKQSNFYTTEVVGVIFTPNAESKSVGVLVSHLLGEDDPSFCRNRGSYVEVGNVIEAPTEPGAVVQTSFNSIAVKAEIETESEQIVSWVSNTCQKAAIRDRESASKNQVSNFAVLVKKRDPIELEFQSYLTSDRGYQFRLKMKDRDMRAPRFCRTFAKSTFLRDCKQTMLSYFTEVVNLSATRTDESCDSFMKY